jgi:FtsZ-interacting cell division protein ZipA
MTDFLETILAARKKSGGWVELLIPIIFVIIYVVSALAKMKKGARDGQIELKERPSLRDTEGKFRYKSLDDTAARQRTRPAPRQPVPTQPRQPIRPQPAARRPQPTVQPRPARVPSHLRPQTPPVRPSPIQPAQVRPPRPKAKQRRVAPKAAPRAVQKLRQPQKVAAAVVKPPAEVVHKPRTLRADLSGSSNLQRAIIYSEILGKPLALRDM